MNLIEMRRALAALVTEARGVLDAARGENRSLNEDEDGRYTDMERRMDALRGQIRDEERRQNLEMEGGQPVGRPPEEQRATFGDALQQTAAREFRSHGSRLQGVEVRGTPSGQNETSNVDGGYLLSPTVTTELLGSVREQSFFLPRARRLTIGAESNSLDMPYWPDKDRANANRYGGTKAYWMDEADQYTASKTGFATRSMKLSKLGALGYATEEMLRDSRYLESIMRDAFLNAMTWEIDEAILFGAGTVEGEAKRPLGLLNATAATGNKALISVAKETSQAAATVNMTNILKMWNRMDTRSRAGAIWLVHPDIELQLIQMTMKTGGIAAGDVTADMGMPVYMPANGLASAPYGTLLGRPVVPNEHMSVPGGVGDIAFIDPGEYFWIDRDGMREATSVHVRFAYDEMAFKFTYRCNGMPSWYDVGTPAKGTTTRSPYVVLSARA